MKEKNLEILTAVLSNWPGRKIAVTLKDISAITGIVPPVLYNYFNGIEDINIKLEKLMISELQNILALKLPGNMPPEMKVKMLIHNLLKFYEDKRYPSFFLTDPEGEKSFMGILVERFEDLLGSGNRLKIYKILHLISAHADFSRETGKKIPEETADEIFRTA